MRNRFEEKSLIILSSTATVVPFFCVCLAVIVVPNRCELLVVALLNERINWSIDEMESFLFFSVVVRDFERCFYFVLRATPAIFFPDVHG